MNAAPGAEAGAFEHNDGRVTTNGRGTDPRDGRPYRVVQWTTGFVGRSALRYLLDRPGFQVVGAKCHSPRKEGRDVADLVRRPPIGVRATCDESALLALDADCVVFTPHDSGQRDPTVPGTLSHEHFQTALRILRSGKNVVSSLCPPTHFRHLADPELFMGEIEAACRTGESSIHFTGVDPGFFTDALAVAVSSGVGRVDRIRTWEILDYFAIPYTGGPLTSLFGRRPEELQEGGHESWIREGWGGVPHLLADAFGQQLDAIDVDFDYWLADESYETPGGRLIEKGTIGAYIFDQHGVAGGRRIFTTTHVNRMGPHTGPDWPTVGHDGGYRIDIEGSTPLRVDIPLGNEGGRGSALADAGEVTAARLVNCIVPLINSSPGYRTFLDLGQITSSLGQLSA
ncbi:NAD(P)H-dependent amine dehydrogenase family protein [Nocardia vaccinii]|uniref:NAD(P)H-dependent amine dehydrogenase family protein n=1 Tax=Nocardia vaccinii TaxID=1822 RepID=UPI0008372DC0|nr:hypothetical protein [Nocardia vaccinii]